MDIKAKLRGLGLNPFQSLDRKGILDQRDVVHDELLHTTAEQQLRAALRALKRNQLSTPLISVVGQTGAGKTHLLNHLARQTLSMSQEDRVLLVDCAAHEALKSNSKELAEVLLLFFGKTLLTPSHPGFPRNRPIDFFLGQLFRYLIENDSGRYQSFRLRYKPIWRLLYRSDAKVVQKLYESINPSRLRTTPPSFEASFSGMLDSLSDDARKRLFNDIHRRIKAWNDKQRTPHLNHVMHRILEIGFHPMSSPNMFVSENHSVMEQLGDWVELASLLDFPIVFSFDQFEDLRILSSESLEQAFYRFLLALMDLLRQIEAEGKSERVPGFLLAVVENLRPSLFGRHLMERMPLLPHGSAEILLDQHSHLSPASLIQLTKTLLNHFWESQKSLQSLRSQVASPTWPFDEKKLNQMYQEFDKSGTLHIRRWLMICRDEWMKEVYGISTKGHSSTSTGPQQSREHVPPPPPREKQTFAGFGASVDDGKRQYVGPQTSAPPNRTVSNQPPYPERSTAPLSAMEPKKWWRKVNKSDMLRNYAKRIQRDPQVFAQRVRDALQFLREQDFGWLSTEATEPQFYPSNDHNQPFVLFSVGHREVALTLSGRSNKGGGFSNEWKRFKDRLEKTTGLEQVVPLMLRTVDESVPEYLQEKVLAYPICKDQKPTEEFLKFLSLLLLDGKLDDIEIEDELKKMPTVKELESLLEQTFTKEWGFFLRVSSWSL